MADWSDLERELDAWSQRGEAATLWWRDDDAVRATPALRQLIELTSIAGGPALPLALAVIPAAADESLARTAEGTPQLSILQHGYTHENHADPGAKKAEFPPGRATAVALRELRAGMERLAGLFGRRALPILVPPWNRIDPLLIGRLGEIGVIGLSTYGPRVAGAGGGGPTLVNTHVDIMRWHGPRGFLGTETCLGLAIGHLLARRHRRVDPGEATGLLTHHLVHDAAAWQFLAQFMQRTRGHPAVHWTDASSLVGCGRGPVA